MVTLLHVPYTLWHLAYVAIGAALAPALDWRVLGGTLLAFAIGLGLSAHALDELNGRPLGTSLSDRALIALAVGGFVAVAALAVVGAVEVSPWIVLWAGTGIVLSSAYCLEWLPALHTVVGFGLAWGAFPVLAGYWAQATSLSAAALLAAAAAVLLSMTQRTLSTPARFVSRGPTTLPSTSTRAPRVGTATSCSRRGSDPCSCSAPPWSSWRWRCWSRTSEVINRPSASANVGESRVVTTRQNLRFGGSAPATTLPGCGSPPGTSTPCGPGPRR